MTAEGLWGRGQRLHYWVLKYPPLPPHTHRHTHTYSLGVKGLLGRVKGRIIEYWVLKYPPPHTHTHTFTHDNTTAQGCGWGQRVLWVGRSLRFHNWVLSIEAAPPPLACQVMCKWPLLVQGTAGSKGPGPGVEVERVKGCIIEYWASPCPLLQMFHVSHLGVKGFNIPQYSILNH